MNLWSVAPGAYMSRCMSNTLNAARLKKDEWGEKYMSKGRRAFGPRKKKYCDFHHCRKKKKSVY
jgi:hypothetical protein